MTSGGGQRHGQGNKEINGRRIEIAKEEERRKRIADGRRVGENKRRRLV